MCFLLVPAKPGMVIYQSYCIRSSQYNIPQQLLRARRDAQRYAAVGISVVRVSDHATSLASKIFNKTFYIVSIYIVLLSTKGYLY